MAGVSQFGLNWYEKRELATKLLVYVGLFQVLDQEVVLGKVGLF